MAIAKKFADFRKSLRSSSRQEKEREEQTVMLTIDKIAGDLFGLDNEDEMQRSLNYIENLFKPNDMITFRVNLHGGFKVQKFFS